MGFLGSLFASHNDYQNQAGSQSPYNAAIPGAIQNTNNVQGQQQGFISALQQQMQGGGPNLGQTQLQGATDRNNAQAAGAVGSVRGLNPQLAARQILGQQAQNNQGAANQSAQLQQQQQLGAQAQLGGQLNTLGQQALGQLNGLGTLQQGQNQLNLQSGVANQDANNGAMGTAANAFSSAAEGAAMLSGGGEAGGKVPALVSPGEMVVPPGGSPQDGQMVPGQAKVAGDSPTNDTVPMNLDEGAVVVPRSVTQSLDPQRVAAFMAAVKGEKPPKEGYAKVAEAKKKYKGGRA